MTYTFSHNQFGFTLVELVTVLAVISVIFGVGVPGMKSYLDTNRLRGATSQFFSDVQYARSESIKRNTNISVSITSNGGDTWCYGIDEASGCDCTITDTTDASACTLLISGTNVLKVGSMTNLPDISMTSPVGTSQTYATFDPVRGLASTTNSVVFQSENNRQTQIYVSVLGKVSVCIPAGAHGVGGYSTCL